MRGYCVICHDSFPPNMENISATVCGHVFHRGCLKTWRKKSFTCPQCRRPIMKDEVVDKLYFSVNPDDDPEQDFLELKAKLSELECKLSRREAANLESRKMAEMQADKINSLELQLDIKNYEFSEKMQNISAIITDLEHVSKTEKQVMDQLKDRYKAAHDQQCINDDLLAPQATVQVDEVQVLMNHEDQTPELQQDQCTNRLRKYQKA